MSSHLSIIFWLGVKELQILAKNRMMIIFMIWAFGFSITMQAGGGGETVNNAAIAIADEDHSQLSKRLSGLFYAPYFQKVDSIGSDEIQTAMDKGKYTFVIEIPPRFEAHLRAGRDTEIQVNADATAVQQASIGGSYIQNIISDEIARFQGAAAVDRGLSDHLVVRRAFNPTGTQAWFRAISGLNDELSMVIIILTGAALLREREHGTIEHLLVMPVTAADIALSKLWSNGLVVIIASTMSLYFIVEGYLSVPVAGSSALLVLGTAIYIFAAASIGIFLGTIAKTMAQFALLMIMTVLSIMMLSGGMTPVESEPLVMQYVTWFLPSRHYISFSQAIIYRGADFSIVWKEFATVFAMGVVFVIGSTLLFRRSIETSK